MCALQDGDALSALRSMLTELQGEQEKLNSTTKELIEEHNRKQKHIDVSCSNPNAMNLRKKGTCLVILINFLTGLGVSEVHQWSISGISQRFSVLLSSPCQV